MTAFPTRVFFHQFFNMKRDKVPDMLVICLDRLNVSLFCSQNPFQREVNHFLKLRSIAGNWPVFETNSKTNQSVKVELNFSITQVNRWHFAQHGSELTLSIAAHALFILSILLNYADEHHIGFLGLCCTWLVLEIDRFETTYPSNNRHHEHKSKAKICFETISLQIVLYML